MITKPSRRDCLSQALVSHQANRCVLPSAPRRAGRASSLRWSGGHYQADNDPSACNGRRPSSGRRQKSAIARALGEGGGQDRPRVKLPERASTPVSPMPFAFHSMLRSTCAIASLANSRTDRLPPVARTWSWACPAARRHIPSRIVARVSPVALGIEVSQIERIPRNLPRYATLCRTCRTTASGSSRESFAHSVDARGTILACEPVASCRFVDRFVRPKVLTRVSRQRIVELARSKRGVALSTRRHVIDLGGMDEQRFPPRGAPQPSIGPR